MDEQVTTLSEIHDGDRLMHHVNYITGMSVGEV